jgi:DNA-binding CsgD family transcriptional regulator
MTHTEMASGFGLLDAAGLPSRIEESFLRRMEPLPPDSKRLLLLAAADPTGDTALLWRACDLAGIGARAVSPVEDTRLVQIGSRVRFFHPLVRSAAYRAAPARERRTAHGLLAAVTDADTDPDRRAWHRAQATLGVDEEVASELERSARRARARGGVAASSAFLERAVALTPDPGRRSQRALAAARAWYEAGGYDQAYGLLDLAEAGPVSEFEGAQAEWLRARIRYARTQSNDEGIPLGRAARRLEPFDPKLARAAYIDALRASSTTQDRLELGRVLRNLPESAAPDPVELLLRGHGVILTEGFPHGTDLLAQAVSAFAAAPYTGDENIEALELAANMARSLWDEAAYDVLTARCVRLAREAGALGLLNNALRFRLHYHLEGGNLAAAVATFDEVEAIRVAGGIEQYPVGLAEISALRDEEDVLTGTIERLRRDYPQAEDAPAATSLQECAFATLYNGLARYQEAFAAAQRSCAIHREGGMGKSLAELIESAARCGQVEAARSALTALTARTRLASMDWGLGVEACLAALLAAGDAAEELYREAVERLGRIRMRLPLARAHLLYGEWLRGERRRADAREQLGLAHDLFEEMGARSFAGRARRELAAVGVTVHTHRNATLDELTAQEARVAVLAGEGLSDREIAGRLYISASTVDYHLRKVFRKLGVRSRSQLHQRLTT